jgi:hypothetical protein
MKSRVYLVLWVGLLAVLFGCSVENKRLESNTSAPNQAEAVTPTHTTRQKKAKEYKMQYVKLGGETQMVNIHRDVAGRFRDFKKFISEYQNKPLNYERSSDLDVTGDGKAEIIRSAIVPEKGNYLVINQILQNNKPIWTDTLHYQDAYGENTWGEDSTYTLLKPYSAFYESSHYTRFVDEQPLPELLSQEGIMAAVLQTRKSQLQKQNSGKKDFTTELKAYEKYLENYKGKMVLKQTLSDAEGYIWYQPDQQFVLLFTP